MAVNFSPIIDTILYCINYCIQAGVDHIDEGSNVGERGRV